MVAELVVGSVVAHTSFVRKAKTCGLVTTAAKPAARGVACEPVQRSTSE